MTLFESRYGYIKQPNPTTYVVGNYQIVAKLELWELSPIADKTCATWIESAAVFYNLKDAIRVALVFNSQDSLTQSVREFMLLQGHMVEQDNSRSIIEQEGKKNE